MRLGYVGCALLALAPVTARCDAATKLVPPDDELLATASYVFDAVAEKRLTERDWLFKGAPIARSPITVGWPPYFVGWWNWKPGERVRPTAAAFPFRPAPQNGEALREGERFLVVADEDFHLLLVYPVGAKPDQYLPGLSEREFRDRVVYLHSLYATVRGFLTEVTDANWGIAESTLCESLRQKVKASGDPQAYLAKLGVPRIITTPVFDILSMGETQAKVVAGGNEAVAGGNDLSVVWAEVALTLTRTRYSMGVRGWEIVQISKVEERP